MFLVPMPHAFVITFKLFLPECSELARYKLKVRMKFLSRVDELNKLACLPCMDLHSSDGRALQRDAEATGSNPAEAPKNVFWGYFAIT